MGAYVQMGYMWTSKPTAQLTMIIASIYDSVDFEFAADNSEGPFDDVSGEVESSASNSTWEQFE
jgi:hypothetical protein